jgi:hypothetical protein
MSCKQTFLNCKTYELLSACKVMLPNSLLKFTIRPASLSSIQKKSANVEAYEAIIFSHLFLLKIQQYLS